MRYLMVDLSAMINKGRLLQVNFEAKPINQILSLLVESMKQQEKRISQIESILPNLVTAEDFSQESEKHSKNLDIMSKMIDSSQKSVETITESMEKLKKQLKQTIDDKFSELMVNITVNSRSMVGDLDSRITTNDQAIATISKKISELSRCAAIEGNKKPAPESTQSAQTDNTKHANSTETILKEFIETKIREIRNETIELKQNIGNSSHTTEVKAVPEVSSKEVAEIKENIKSLQISLESTISSHKTEEPHESPKLKQIEAEISDVRKLISDLRSEIDQSNEEKGKILSPIRKMVDVPPIELNKMDISSEISNEPDTEKENFEISDENENVESKKEISGKEILPKPNILATKCNTKDDDEEEDEGPKEVQLEPQEKGEIQENKKDNGTSENKKKSERSESSIPKEKSQRSDVFETKGSSVHSAADISTPKVEKHQKIEKIILKIEKQPLKPQRQNPQLPSVVTPIIQKEEKPSFQAADTLGTEKPKIVIQKAPTSLNSADFKELAERILNENESILSAMDRKIDREFVERLFDKFRSLIRSLNEKIKELAANSGEFATKEEIEALASIIKESSKKAENGAAVKKGPVCLFCGRPKTGVAGEISPRTAMRAGTPTVRQTQGNGEFIYGDGQAFRREEFPSFPHLDPATNANDDHVFRR